MNFRIFLTTVVLTIIGSGFVANAKAEPFAVTAAKTAKAMNVGVLAALDSIQSPAVTTLMAADPALAPRLADAVEVESADPAKVRLYGVLGALDAAEATSDALRRLLSPASLAAHIPSEVVAGAAR